MSCNGFSTCNDRRYGRLRQPDWLLSTWSTIYPLLRPSLLDDTFHFSSILVAGRHMLNFRKQAMRPLVALKHQPWSSSPAIAPQLSMKEPIEEENTPYYSPVNFYPAQLGEVLNNRYQLVTKFGYGTSPTI